MRIAMIPVLLAAMFLASCATVPMADSSDDLAAKAFAPAPGKANVYVFREKYTGIAVTMMVLLDGDMIGNTVSGSYAYKEVNPGRHLLSSLGQGTPTIAFEAEAGRNYFVKLRLTPGMFAPNSELQIVDETQGKADVARRLMVGRTGSA